jgi:hypothetical protein
MFRWKCTNKNCKSFIKVDIHQNIIANKSKLSSLGTQLSYKKRYTGTQVGCDLFLTFLVGTQITYEINFGTQVVCTGHFMSLSVFLRR